jgi:ubiquitin-protein ligase
MANRVANGQVRKFYRRDDETAQFTMFFDPSDARKCYVFVAGLGAPFEGGEFFFLLKIGGGYPAAPPTFSALTENGVFAVSARGADICVSIGRYHSERWPAAIGLEGFVRSGVINGLLCYDALEHGIGIHNGITDAKCQRAARASVAYNAACNAPLVAQLREGIETGQLPLNKATRAFIEREG